MTRKILSSVLCLLLVASTVFTVACAGEGESKESGSNNGSNGPGGNESTIPGDTSSSSSKDDIPEDALFNVNFAEDDEPTVITFAFAESADDSFTERSIAIDPDIAEDNPVNAAIEARNAILCAQLGVEIDSYRASESIQGLQEAINLQMSGMEPEIDVIVGYQYYDINIATQGWILNLADMKDDLRGDAQIEYLNYATKSYWGNDYIDALSYKGIVYWVTGDLSLRFVGGMYCTYINKTLYNQYVAPVIADTEGSVYEIVDRGEWTMEKLYTLSTLVYADSNGDGTVDQEDVLGYAWEQNDPLDGLAFGCQVPYSTKNATTGDVSITLNTTRTTTFVRELEKLLYDVHSLNVGDSDSTIVMPLFASGSVGFTVNKLFQAERYLGDMSDDYMIVPVPKLNTDQKDYTTGIHDGCSIYGISYYSDAKTAAAATLEMMAYLSHATVLPVYYDLALKSMYTNDETSARMIDLIHANVSTDFAAAWSASIQNIAHWFRSHNKETRFTSDLNRYDGAHKTALENLIKDLEEFAQG